MEKSVAKHIYKIQENPCFHYVKFLILSAKKNIEI